MSTRTHELPGAEFPAAADDHREEIDRQFITITLTPSAHRPNSSTRRATSPGAPGARSGPPRPGPGTAAPTPLSASRASTTTPKTGLHYNHFRHYDPETGRYTSPDPLGLAPAPNPVAYVHNPLSGCDPHGLMPKYTKEEKARKRLDKVLDEIAERAQDGGFKKRHDYHGDTRHAFSDERVLEILKNPDAVYHSTGTAATFTFRQGGDIVVIDGPGNTQGQAITAYGPSGVKGESGATALGGKPTDPGAPVTHEDIVNGRIPAKDGRFQPPAVQIR